MHRKTGAVLVGTSGYVYPHWRGRFYPRSLPARDWLRHYARYFSTVELNAPFYRLPAPEHFDRWRAEVPAGFVFAVKASRFLTHVKRLRDPEAPLALLLERARRLGPALGPVLFQLPPHFHRDVDRLDGLLRALHRQRLVRGLRAVLEVRHPSWLDDTVLARLRGANVALCLADGRAAPVDDVVTADFVYVRRHGFPGRRTSRYPERALARDAAAIRRWRRQGRDVHVYFNNDDRAFAVGNALRLRDLVAGRRRHASSQAATTPASARASSRYTREIRPRAA